MILPQNKTASSTKGAPPADELPVLDTPPTFDEAVAGPSTRIYPAEQDGDDSRSFDAHQEGLPLLPHNEAPPEFTPWNAQFSLTSSGDIYSHDPHLNEDGEALYRFITSQLQPPTFRIHCRGTHTEQRVRVNSSHHHHHRTSNHHGTHGGQHTVHSGNTQIEEVSVIDFDFYLDLTHLLQGPDRAEIWTIDHSIPAYRGSMYLQVARDTPPPVTRSPRSDVKKNPSFFKRIGARRSLGARIRTAVHSARVARAREGQLQLPEDQDIESNRSRSALPGDDQEEEPEPLWRGATRREKKKLRRYNKWRASTGVAPWTPMSVYDAAVGEYFDASGSTSGPPSSSTPRAPGVQISAPMTVRDWADDYCRSKKILKDFKFEKSVYGWDFAALRTSIEDLIRATPYNTSLSITFESSANSISIRPNTPLSRALSKKWVVVLLWIFLIYPFIWLFRRYSAHGGGRWEVCGAAYALKTAPVTRVGPDGNLSSTAGAVQGMKEGEWFRSWKNTIEHGVRARVQDATPLRYRGAAEGILDGY